MATLLFTAAMQFLLSKFGRYSAISSITILSAWLYAIDGSHGNGKRVFTRGLLLLNQAIDASAHRDPLRQSELVAPMPAGLINMRNTCYMNAILQSLFSVKPYSHSLMNGSFAFKEGSVGMELQRLFVQMQNASEQVIKLPILPRSLAMKLKIDISQQEDAEELMLKILNEVDDSRLDAGLKKDKLSRHQTAMQRYNIKPSAVFDMELQQTITCTNFQHISSTRPLTNFDLSVDIKGIFSLEQAIEQHFQPELLTGENQYRCQTHGLQDAQRSLRISKFPRVLALHLKRFSFDPITYAMKKVIDPMDIPLELNMRRYAFDNSTMNGSSSSLNSEFPAVLQDETAGIYDLTAVAVHEGSLEVGHYYTFAKIPLLVKEKQKKFVENTCNSSDRYTWVKLNDQQVTHVTEEEVLQVARGKRKGRATNTIFQRMMDNDTSTNAYLLFYTQRD